MKISIVMPSFNQGAFIGEALESIFSQGYDDLEVIVMDGASTDNTVDVLKQYEKIYPQLKWASEPDNGPADAVNKALHLASGDICGIQSTDDLYLPNTLNLIAESKLANPQCQMFFGDVQLIDGKGKVIANNEVPKFSWESWFAIALCVPQSSIFFDTSLAKNLGGWRGEYYGCDLDLWLRMLFKTSPIHVGSTLSAWRVYEEQRTTPAHFEKILDGFIRMIDESTDIQNASLRIRRLAIAAKHIAAIHFGPENKIWLKRKHALLALLFHPTFPRYAYGNLLRSLIPGYSKIKSLIR